MMLDIAAARSRKPYTRKDVARRMLWMLVRPFFAFTPRPMFAWRAFVLRALGARIGRGLRVSADVHIFMPWNLDIGDDVGIGDRCYLHNPAMITIGARASISHLAHLCAASHDYSDPALPLLLLPISVGEDSWICAQAMICPGLTVGQGAIVGAGAVATADVEPWTIVAGNPAKFIKQRVMRTADA